MSDHMDETNDEIKIYQCIYRSTVSSQNNYLKIKNTTLPYISSLWMTKTEPSADQIRHNLYIQPLTDNSLYTLQTKIIQLHLKFLAEIIALA